MRDLSDNPQRYRFRRRGGNHFDTLVDGSNFLPHMPDAIYSARQTILFEMYLIGSGTVMDRFIIALLDAAERGVQVYLMLDDYGAIGLKQRDRVRLVHKSIHTVYYNRLRSHRTLCNLYRIFLLQKEHGLYRDHRNQLVQTPASVVLEMGRHIFTTDWSLTASSRTRQ